MRLWERFWGAVLGEADPPPTVRHVPASEETWHGQADPERARRDDVVEARARRAAERLLDDERPRRNLTDAQFGPLLEWALALVEREAETTAGQSDDAAERRIDRVLGQLRETLTEVDRRAGGLESVGVAQIDRLIAEVIRASDAETGRRSVLDGADHPPKDAAADKGSA